jgi:hypothetical protein
MLPSNVNVVLVVKYADYCSPNIVYWRLAIDAALCNYNYTLPILLESVLTTFPAGTYQRCL